mgnify:CR=1 FL=1
MPYAVRGLVWAARGFKVPAFSVGTSMAYDILIRGGMLLDGSGKPGVPGDLAIEGGRIVALGQNIGGTAKKTIDATGLASRSYALMVDREQAAGAAIPRPTARTVPMPSRRGIPDTRNGWNG